MSIVRKEEFSFLGTLAGDQCFTISPIGKTYSRRFVNFGMADVTRNKIAKIGTSIGRQEEGFNYREGPTWYNKDCSWYSGGGYFQTLEELSQIEAYLGADSYALKFFGKKLEELSGKKLSRLQDKCTQLGIDSILLPYFKPVNVPRDGDLVVYRGGELPHAGVYRTSKPNWHSPEGGTVTSKWSRGHTSQTDVFFISSDVGDVAQFFRIRDEAVSSPLPIPTLSGPLNYRTNKEGALIYLGTSENDELRTMLGKMKVSFIPAKVPSICHLEHLNVFRGNCAKYAMVRALEVLEKDVTLPCHEPSSTELFIKKHFVLTETPSKGDVAVYSRGTFPVHFGIYLSKDYIESNWGGAGTLRHPPFHVPHIYGDKIEYYKLNPESFE